ncbi:hypothetical protein [Aquabacterium sp. UBA2148]|uniref:hypothetical protein n=1 Tax=Aquabacterium sp. UBA2148 TaxID=1946042 RepID=UPI00257B2D26|nr:hypothetical protein [Aquabacterium sp. UBA2148]
MSRQTAQEISRVASRQVDRIADAAGNALDQAHDAADQALSSVQNGAQHLAERAPGLVDLAIDRVKHLGERGSDIARATSAMAMDKARLAADHTADRIRRDPLKSVLIAVAAGAAVAVIASHMAHRRQSSGGRSNQGR